VDALLKYDASARFTTMEWFMRKGIKAYLSDESGSAAVEYALILVVIGTSVATAAIAFGNAVGGALQNAGTVISGITF
jgi:Flp pilus assembly pilin Flp